jgi:parallel beta-helix repeat protein
MSYNPESGGDTYFQIMEAGASYAAVQAALNDAGTDIVLLKPGDYDWENNNVVVPANKALVGLDGVYQGAAVGARVELEIDATHRIQMNNGSRLENIKFRFASTSTAGNEFIETVTNDGIVIRGVNVDGSLVATGDGIVSWAIRGAVKEVTHCSFNKCAGIYVDQTTQEEGGISEIGHIHWTAHSSDISSDMIGVRISFGPAWVHDIHGEVGYGTLYVSGPDIMAERILCESNQVYGVNWSSAGTEGTLTDVRIDGGRWGCRLSAPRMTVNNFYARDTTDRGFWSENQGDSVITNVFTFNCGGTGTAAGIYITGAVRSVLSTLSSYSGGTYGVHLRQVQQGTVSNVLATQGGGGAGHHGIYLETCVRSTFTGMEGYLNGFASGIYLYNCSHNSLSGLNGYDNGTTGITLSQSDNNSISGWKVGENTADGIEVNSTSDYNNISNGEADDNGGDGIDCAAGNNGNFFGNVLTRANGGWGVLGGNAGGVNNTLDGHTSHGDTAGARSLGAGWNTGGAW